MTKTDRQARLQDEIEKNLKRAFDDVANEELPDRFAQLLQTLRADGGAHDSNRGSAAREINDE